MDIALVLDHVLPGAVYGGSLTENTQAAYDALVWGDARPKPSWAEIGAAAAGVDQSETAKAQITALEEQVTARRLREAALGDAAALAFIQDVDNQIAALRPLVGV